MTISDWASIALALAILVIVFAYAIGEFTKSTGVLKKCTCGTFYKVYMPYYKARKEMQNGICEDCEERKGEKV